jgi:AhpD family alkylhydroperoxidase
MEQRLNFYQKGHNALAGMYTLSQHLSKSPVEKSLLELVHFRVSQINGCAYCLDMHSKDLRAAGETEQRLYVLDAWREAPFYSDRERAALAYAEAITKLTGANVPDEVYEEACRQFTDTELIDLTLAIVQINSFNRLNITFRIKAGGYKVGEHAALTT